MTKILLQFRPTHSHVTYHADSGASTAMTPSVRAALGEARQWRPTQSLGTGIWTTLIGGCEFGGQENDRLSAPLRPGSRIRTSACSRNKRPRAGPAAASKWAYQSLLGRPAFQPLHPPCRQPHGRAFDSSPTSRATSASEAASTVFNEPAHALIDPGFERRVAVQCARARRRVFPADRDPGRRRRARVSARHLAAVLPLPNGR